MISNKEELKYYIAVDRIMNGRPEKRTFKEIILDRISRGGRILRYLRAMRMYAYYANTTHSGQYFRALIRLYWGRQYRKLGLQLGFSIGHNTIGYGVKIPHYGTIVINGEARIGNFSVLHTSTCIAGKIEVGDFFYLSTGSQLVGNINIGNNVSVAAHSLVNKCYGNDVLLAGSPAKIVRTDYPNWIQRDGNPFQRQLEKVLIIKKGEKYQ